MTIHSIKFLALTACLFALAGCKTPQPALDQANNGAALTVSLQAQLAALRTTQANIAKLRIERIRRQNAAIAELQAASAFDERIRTAAGDTSGSQLASDLRSLADSRAKDDEDLEAALAALDASMASLLDPVPPQDANLAATQKALAALGEQLPLEQRARIIAAFAADLKKSIDKIKDSGEPPSESLPAAPTQPIAGEPLANTGQSRQ